MKTFREQRNIIMNGYFELLAHYNYKPNLKLIKEVFC